MLGSMLRRMLKLYQSLGLTSYLFIYSMLFLFVIYKIKDNISAGMGKSCKKIFRPINSFICTSETLAFIYKINLQL